MSRVEGVSRAETCIGQVASASQGMVDYRYDLWIFCLLPACFVQELDYFQVMSTTSICGPEYSCTAVTLIPVIVLFPCALQ
jgi:hypothetical protein